MAKKECFKCVEYLEFHGKDIKCPKHRKPDVNGIYEVGCRKCDNVILSHYSEDSICPGCAL